MEVLNKVSRETTLRKLKSRYLIVVLGYNQKETSEIVGVSRHTMCVWAKKYNWKEQKIGEIEASGGYTALAKGFLDHIQIAAPNIYKKVSQLHQEYMQCIEKEFNAVL